MDELRTYTAHSVLILQKYFEEVLTGVKTFELRKNDRDYKVGDTIILNEFDGKYLTSRVCIVQITYVLKDVPMYGLMDGYAILGIKRNHE